MRYDLPSGCHCSKCCTVHRTLASGTARGQGSLTAAPMMLQLQRCVGSLQGGRLQNGAAAAGG